MIKINPFSPNLPVPYTMFVGRDEELKTLQRCIIQTRASRPSSFLIIGERGIGKTSLLNYVNWLAQGKITLHQQPIKFLVINTTISETTTIIGLLKKISFNINTILKNEDPVKDFFQNTWEFIKRVEAFGVKLNEEKKEEDIDNIIEQFSYDMAKLSTKICNQENTELFDSPFQGILILIDEADHASKAMHLGSFVKNFIERLYGFGCNQVMIGLAGLPKLRDILFDSHQSSIRLFQFVTLDRLSKSDIDDVVDKCIGEGNKINSLNLTIDNEARKMIHTLSEGYPHFIQQYGYSAYHKNEDDVIDKKDVLDGATDKGGALETIGERFFYFDFYKKIQNDDYRQVLRIMSESYADWITKKEIKNKFTGSDSTLSNALSALRNKKIILSKKGEKGVYRLQHVGFALWIRNYTKVGK